VLVRFLYFENLHFCGIFKLLENVCHRMRVVGQTLKEKKNYFWYFLKNKCHTVRATGQTQKSEKEHIYYYFFYHFFASFDNFQVFCFFFQKKKINKK